MINEFDVKMFFVMDAMKALSKCRDKQVVCIIVDRDNNIESMGINTIFACNNACEDKAHRICEVVHAERRAMEACYIDGSKGLRAYVNLFPCGPCQDALDPFVDEIVTFGMAHKEWKSDKIQLFPHPFYSGKPKQPLQEPGQVDVIKKTMAESLFVVGDVLSTLQDQRSTFREEFSKELYLLIRDNLESRFGVAGLQAVTKETYRRD